MEAEHDLSPPADGSSAAAADAVASLLSSARELPEDVRGTLERVAMDLRRTEGELGSVVARYRALVEQIPAIVYIDVADDSLATTYVSPQIETLLGITPDEYTSDPHVWTRHLHPEDRDRALEEYLRGRESGEPFTYEYRLIAKDGRVVWFRDSATIVRDADDTPAFVHGVMLDVTDAREAEERAAFVSYHDRLTGLPNRAMFEEYLDLAIARARRADDAVAVMMIDVDDFKLVNDSLGHEAGDALIVELAARLREATRDTDLVSRQGGDEFLLLLADLEKTAAPGIPNATDGATLVAESVATRIQEALRVPFELGETEVYMTASIGIALFPHHAADATQLLRDADTAMYRSKRMAPGGYSIYADGGQDLLGKLSLSTRLRKAVENQNWELHYQPIVDLVEGSMTGVEALIRWNDPNGGLVQPGDFIPLAEEMGLIEAIGDWVVDELARQGAAWRAQGLELELSFNLSPRQLWQPEVGDRITERIEAAHIDPRRVLVEITETAAMTDPDRTLRILRDLRARGLRVALDDFGTGYSSLSRLKDLPVDVLKVDRSFVRDVSSQPANGSMVQAIVQLAHALGMTPLAEGIETQDDWLFLVERGCRLGQGYFFSRPVPAEDILARHRRSAIAVVEPA
ncbi:MAG: putative bifunctional diguanylate cyclase/phosphodiesterase [Actinomycetota bacterium]